MLKSSVKDSLRAGMLLLLFVSIVSLYAFHNVSMWEDALTYSKDNSTAMGTFVQASEWLSKRLGQDEIAVVPSIEVFYVLNPELCDRLVDYRSLWASAGVSLRERTDRDKLLQLRKYFIDFLKGNFSARYIVRDWMDPYAMHLFEAPIDDELMLLLREVEVIPFTLSTGSSSKITIYEKV